MEDAAFSFLTKDKKEFPDVSSTDNDLFSWLLFNSDLVAGGGGGSSMINHGGPHSVSASAAAVAAAEAASLVANMSALTKEERVSSMREDDQQPTTTSSSPVGAPVTNSTTAGGARSTRGVRGTGSKPARVSSPPATTINNNRGKKRHLTSKRTSVSVSDSASTQQQQQMQLNEEEDEDGMSEDDTGLEEKSTMDSKRQQRLIRNREIAKQCRARKRERIGALEDELIRLREWNKQLEKKLNQGDDGENREEIRQREMKEIITMVSSSVTETEMKKKLEAYKEVYSDFGKQRRVAITFHLDQLKALLLPNQVSKMTLWSLQQDDEFYDEKKNQSIYGGGIWNMLCAELGLTDDQKKALVEMRHSIRNQRKNVGECLRILHELEQRIDENFSSMAGQMATIMRAITPLQQAKFLIWIENNQPFMHMLSYLYNQNNGNIHPGSESGGSDNRSPPDDMDSEDDE